MRSTWMRRVASATVLSVALAACGGGETTTDPSTEPTDTTSPSETEAPTGANVDGQLTVGILLPQTGDLAVLGPPMFEAVRLAASQIEEAGGIPGLTFKVVESDSGTNEDVANGAADTLIQSDNVDAIIGAASSRITLSVIDKITGAGIVECSPSNTGSSLTAYDDNGGFYVRTAPPDNLQGPALASRMVADGASAVAVIALADEYGQGFAGFLKTKLVEEGADIVADVAYDPNGSDFAADVQKVIDASPDAVALISFPETGNKILQGLLENGINPGQIYTADGMQSTDVISGVFPDGDGSELNGMTGTAPSSQGSEAFQTAFAAFAPEGTAQIFSAHAYDCMIIIALAAAVAGTDDPAAIQKELINVTKGGEKCTDFPSCIELVKAGTDIDYDGASGPGEWADAGEPAAGTYEVWEFRDGAVATLDTVDVS